MFLPEIGVVTGVAKTLPSFSFPWAWTRTVRGFLNRMFHPFASAKTKAPKYQDSRLRGLLLEVQVPTEPIRLSEVRQLRVQAILRNIGGSPVPLDFPTSQRIDIHLLNSAGEA